MNDDLLLNLSTLISLSDPKVTITFILLIQVLTAPLGELTTGEI